MKTASQWMAITLAIFFGTILSANAQNNMNPQGACLLNMLYDFSYNHMTLYDMSYSYMTCHIAI